MKKIVSVVFCAAVMASCSPTDYYQTPVDPVETTTDDVISNEEIIENAENMLGVAIDPNHDWCTIVSGDVNITVDASVSKVQLLAKVCEIDEDCPSYVSRNGMHILNETEVDGPGTIKLHYDAPKENLGLYVTYTTNKGLMISSVKDNTASIADIAKASTRTVNYTLPTGEFKISGFKTSYASDRNWNPGELLYELSDEDYNNLKMSSTEWTDEFKSQFEGIVDECFPNGRSENNLPKVKASGFYNEKSYITSTGEDPIIVTPVYKCDHPQEYGNEVYYSEIYYYYFKKDATIGESKNDTINFIKALPKYKLMPLSICFQKDGDDDIVKRFGSFALLWYGDGTPSAEDIANGNVKGSFDFPEGYQIGFMVRTNTTWDDYKKQGEVYCDGRMNGNINTDKRYNFSSSKMGATDPRAAWLTVNNKSMLCWESGTDSDFNDIIMEFEGGFTGPTPPPSFKYTTYTFCFEDTFNGDYDMNDVVIKAERKNATTIKYSILACGAHDDLYIKNINDEVSNTEVHALLGAEPKTFVNTEKGGQVREARTFTVTVDKEFSILNKLTQPYIYDATKKHEIHVSDSGAPYAIVIATPSFKYPLEKVSISKAYKHFNTWAANHEKEKKWYNLPYDDKVY